MNNLKTLRIVVLVVNILNFAVAALNIITGLAISDLPNPMKLYTIMDPQAKYYFGVSVFIIIVALSNIIQAFIELSKQQQMLATHINVILNHLLCGCSFAVISISAIFLKFFDKAYPNWEIMGDEYNHYFNCIIAQCIFVPIVMLPTIFINNKYSREKLIMLYPQQQNISKETKNLKTLKNVVLVINILNLGVTALNIITGTAIIDLPIPKNTYTYFDPQAKYYFGAAVFIIIVAQSNIIQALLELSKQQQKLFTHINVILNHLLCGCCFAVLSISAIFLKYFDQAIPNWEIMGDQYNYYFDCIIAQCILVPIIMLPTIFINNKYSREKLIMLYDQQHDGQANEPFIKS